MKVKFLIISFLVLYSFNYCFGQERDSIFLQINKKEFSKIVFINKSEFSKKIDKGFKFSEDYYNNYKEQSIKDIREIAKEYPNLIKVHSKDSIEIIGLDRKEVIKNFKSLTNDRDFEFFKSYAIEGNLFFVVNGYETWHTIILNIDSCKVFELSNNPMFLNKNELISLNHYYGDDEFEYYNIENNKYFGFSLNAREIENYYILNKVAYFKVLRLGEKHATYFKINLNELTDLK
ncbi:hypothetical protein [uncultured Tenacibaculum sp.]|uniref:hypothetical protein n=1 Tax=uncultured Tenacibaculum sp. TaxID=174713 RepID=UPI002616575A|nr:hypothetical protein [uncultured Tenacibaculum sp.]